MSNNEILREFLLETHENLALLDSDLVKLETNPDEKATLAQVFRTLHSVKGTAGFMGLVKLQAVAHSAESLLSRLRAGEMRFNAAIATALLQVVDAIREMLSHIETSESEGSGDYTALVAQIDRLREAGDSGTDTTTVLPPLPKIVIEKSIPIPGTEKTVAFLPENTTDMAALRLPAAKIGPPTRLPIDSPLVPPQPPGAPAAAVAASQLPAAAAQTGVSPRLDETVSNEPVETRSTMLDAWMLDAITSGPATGLNRANGAK